MCYSLLQELQVSHIMAVSPLIVTQALAWRKMHHGPNSKGALVRTQAVFSIWHEQRGPHGLCTITTIVSFSSGVSEKEENPPAAIC